MFVTALGTAAMTMGALSVAELPSWLAPAQQWPTSPAPAIEVITPSNTCPIPGTELSGRRCVQDCRSGICRRIRVAEAQTTIYGPDGRVQGRAVPQGEGSVRYYDAQGRSLGTSTTTGTGTTTFYGPGGNVTGRSSGPAPAPRPAFSSPK
jgi:hypothetical protein